MYKKVFLSVIAVIILVAAFYYFLSFIQNGSEEKIIKIGVVRTPPALDVAWEGFKRKMDELGWREGKNIEYVVEASGNNFEEAKKSIDKFLKDGVDMIYTMGVSSTRAAKEVTAEKNPNLPVVFGVVSDPVGGGLVQSEVSSGNNLTGVTPSQEIVGSKRLEIFLEISPDLKRIIFPWNDPKTTGVNELKNTASLLKIEFLDKKVESVDELDSFLSSFLFRKGDGILRATDSVSAGRTKQMIALAIDKKIPLAGTNLGDTRNGALFSYGASYAVIGEQAAVLVHKILRGAKPSELPIEGANQIELAVNLKTAELIGLDISDKFLSKADLVIK